MRRRGRERWRSMVKAAVAGAIVWTWPLAAFLAQRRRQPLVLGYHRVVDDFLEASRTEMPAMLTSRAMFERHLDWLAKHFRFATLDEVGCRIAEGGGFDNPVVAITFDDGYRDVYEQAYPVLKRRGIPAAMFVVTDLIGRPSPQVHDTLYHAVAKAFATWDDPRRELFGVLSDVGIPAEEVLRERSATKSPTMVMSTLLPRLSQAQVGRIIRGLEAGLGNAAGTVPQTLAWSELAEMQRNGITIASHTQTHVSLPMETPERVAAELAGSKRALEQHLQTRVDHFAYPGGQFTRPVVEATATAGYGFAYTACPHGHPRYPHLTIERLLLWEGSSVDADGRFSSDIFSCQAHRLWPPALKCERVHRL